MNKGLLTIKDAAFYTSMGESTIDRDVKDGKFPSPVWVNTNKYWRRVDIDKWIEGLPTEKSEMKKETRGRKRLSI